MKIWLIEAPWPPKYEYISAVVIANTKKEAALLHPDDRQWDGKECPKGTWCASKDVKVTEIGVSILKEFNGVVCYELR